MGLTIMTIRIWNKPPDKSGETETGGLWLYMAVMHTKELKNNWGTYYHKPSVSLSPLVDQPNIKNKKN